MCLFGMVSLGHIAFDGTKLKRNASVRQNGDRDSLEKEIERINEQMSQRTGYVLMRKRPS